MLVAVLGRSERRFSERDRDVLDLVRPVLEAALRDAQARERLARACHRAAAADRRCAARPLRRDRAREPRRRALARRALWAAERAGWLPDPSLRGSLCPRVRRSSAYGTDGTHRPPAARRSTRAAVEEEVAGFVLTRSIASARTRARPRCSVPWPRSKKRRTSGGSCASACTQSETARAPGSQTRRTHGRRRRRPGASREHLDSRPTDRTLPAWSPIASGAGVPVLRAPAPTGGEHGQCTVRAVEQSDWSWWQTTTADYARLARTARE
jgi:hypothetical protein